MHAPQVIVFDVNETLSDMAPLSERFERIGLPAHEAELWFAALLRDGFALTAAGDEASFPMLAAEGIRRLWAESGRVGDEEAAVQEVMTGMAELRLHPDVVDGVRALKATGARLVTLTNGNPEIAERLFAAAGIRGDFERLLGVAGNAPWKPTAAAYDYAAAACRTTPAEMLLVAVHAWDIHGASKVGMRTAWIDRSGARYPAYFRRPDYTISALTDLAALLAQ